MRTITVKGVGSVSAKPDYITLSLVIESTDKEYDIALQKATKRIHLLQKVAKQNNFEDGSLKTTGFHVTTEYENVKVSNGNFRREFAGYRCTYQLKLSFEFDSLRLAKILSSISASGAKPELSIAFTVKEPSKVSRTLLENASLNAKEKADVLCHCLGVKLGELLSIDYNWGELNVLSRTRYEIADEMMPLMAASEGYAHWAKIHNLQEAARTINYLTENGLLRYADLEAKVEDIHSSYERTGTELITVESRLREVQPLIKNISNYHRFKPVYESYQRAKDKAAFRSSHEAELVIFEAARSTLLAIQGDAKLPSLKSLRAEQEQLTQEQQRLYEERANLKRQAKQIDTIRANIISYLNLSPEQEIQKAKDAQRE